MCSNHAMPVAMTLLQNTFASSILNSIVPDISEFHAFRALVNSGCNWIFLKEL